MSNKEDLNKATEEVVDENKEVKVEEVKEMASDEKENIKETTEEVEEFQDVTEKIEGRDRNCSIWKRIFANFLDQAITLGFSAIILVIFGLIIRIFGYAIAMPIPMLLIAYIVVNILYYPLFEKTDGKTIGKRILAID